MIGHSFIYPKASSGAVRFRAPRRGWRVRVNHYRPAEFDLPSRSKPRVHVAYDPRQDESAARWYMFPKYPGHLWKMIQEAVTADRSLMRNDRPLVGGSAAGSTAR